MQRRAPGTLRRVLAAAAVGAVVTLVPAGAAIADVNVQVNPGKVRAGERITLFAECGATATSDVFGTVRLSPDEAGNVAVVTLRRNVRPGTYRVSFRCDNGETGTRTFEVAGPPRPAPLGGPQTGAGTGRRPESGQIAGGLVAAGVAAAGLGAGLIRRRRRRDAAIF